MILTIEESTNYAVTVEKQLNRQGVQEFVTEKVTFKYGQKYFSRIDYLFSLLITKLVN